MFKSSDPGLILPDTELTVGIVNGPNFLVRFPNCSWLLLVVQMCYRIGLWCSISIVQFPTSPYIFQYIDLFFIGKLKVSEPFMSINLLTRWILKEKILHYW